MENMFYDIKRDGVSQGLLSTFLRCRMEAKLHLDGLQRIQESAPLQFGSIAHRVLEVVYTKYKTPPTDVQVKTELRIVEKEFRKEEGARLSDEGMQNLETNCAILEVLLPEYFKFYKKDFGASKWVELEQKFKVKSPVEGIELVGRIDGAFNVRKELWLFESKTKGRIEEESLTDSLAFDFQTNFYQYALRKKYGTHPSGVLYNVIRRPGERLKQNEKLHQFAARILEKVKADPKYYFIRWEISTPKSEMKLFEEELAATLKEFKQWRDGLMATVRNTSACIQKYGPCRFLPICANGDRQLYRIRKEVYPELKD